MKKSEITGDAIRLAQSSPYRPETCQHVLNRTSGNIDQARKVIECCAALGIGPCVAFNAHDRIKAALAECPQ